MIMAETNGVIICASHIGGLRAVRYVLDSNTPIAGAVCPSPEQGKLWRISGYFDYRPMLTEHGIDVYRPASYSLTAQSDKAFFSDRRFSVLVQGGWQRLFPTSVLDSLEIGALGVHGSSDLLPKGRGRSPLNWSLIEGKERFLMHLFLITDGTDDGDIIDVADFDITPFDDIRTLYLKYSIVYRDLLVENLPNILAGTFRVRPQKGIPTYYSKRDSSMGLIDWESMDVWEIHNFIRAQTHPYPGAFGMLDSRCARIWSAVPFDTRIRYDSRPYGSVVETDERSLIVNCRGGLLLVNNWEWCEPHSEEANLAKGSAARVGDI